MMSRKFVLSVCLILLGVFSGVCYGAEIHDAALEGNLDRVKELVEQGADVNAKNENGDAVMIYAAYKYRWDVVKYLVEQGADVNAKTDKGLSVLHSAALRNKSETIEYLASYANVVPPLKSNFEVVKWLVEHGAEVDAKSDDGVSVLHYAASNGCLNTVQFLVEHGADINVKPEEMNRCSILNLAIENDDKEHIQWLKDHGAKE